MVWIEARRCLEGDAASTCLSCLLRKLDVFGYGVIEEIGCEGEYEFCEESVEESRREYNERRDELVDRSKARLQG